MRCLLQVAWHAPPAVRVHACAALKGDKLIATSLSQEIEALEFGDAAKTVSAIPLSPPCVAPAQQDLQARANVQRHKTEQNA